MKKYESKISICKHHRIVTAFAASAVAIGVGNNYAYATNCAQQGAVNVGALCETKVCANVNAIASGNLLRCTNG